MNVEIVPATIGDTVALTSIQQQAFKRLYDTYGWVENGEILGVVGVLTHPNKIEITNIAE